MIWVVEVDGYTVAECSSCEEGLSTWQDFLDNANPGQVVALEEVEEEQNVWRCLECVRVEVEEDLEL